MSLLKTLQDKMKNLDGKVKKIMHIGFIFSFFLCIVSTLSLFTYETMCQNPSLFYTGISLFRTSLMFACMFFICGIGFDSIKKETI